VTFGSGGARGVRTGSLPSSTSFSRQAYLITRVARGYSLVGTRKAKRNGRIGQGVYRDVQNLAIAGARTHARTRPPYTGFPRRAVAHTRGPGRG
jgi:hypothetical protein